ncbi:MAG: hypothetical protein U0X39_11220 [Bacteroidales bacterium]
MNKGFPIVDDNRIAASRGRKNETNPFQPYAWLVEKERTAAGQLIDTGIIFLTNKECPYKCLMCDLWKNTTDTRVPAGAITEQIKWALAKMPGIRRLKLYNSGSFFDHNAIDPREYKEIASLVSNFERIIVECHPNLVNESALRFRELLNTELEIAMGLEIADNEILRALNKKMTTNDYCRASDFLRDNNMPVRTFVLLRPPFLTEHEGITHAEKTVDFAFDNGSESCIIIPVRAGNGAMDELKAKGQFNEPRLRSLELVLERCLKKKRGLVFADTWDLKLFSDCDKCFEKRLERITIMNNTQEVPFSASCDCLS